MNLFAVTGSVPSNVHLTSVMPASAPRYALLVKICSNPILPARVPSPKDLLEKGNSTTSCLFPLGTSLYNFTYGTSAEICSVLISRRGCADGFLFKMLDIEINSDFGMSSLKEKKLS